MTFEMAERVDFGDEIGLAVSEKQSWVRVRGQGEMFMMPKEGVNPLEPVRALSRSRVWLASYRNPQEELVGEITTRELNRLGDFADVLRIGTNLPVQEVPKKGVVPDWDIRVRLVEKMPTDEGKEGVPQTRLYREEDWKKAPRIWGTKRTPGATPPKLVDENGGQDEVELLGTATPLEFAGVPGVRDYVLGVKGGKVLEVMVAMQGKSTVWRYVSRGRD